MKKINYIFPDDIPFSVLPQHNMAGFYRATNNGFVTAYKIPHRGGLVRGGLEGAARFLLTVNKGETTLLFARSS